MITKADIQALAVPLKRDYIMIHEGDYYTTTCFNKYGKVGIYKTHNSYQDAVKYFIEQCNK